MTLSAFIRNHEIRGQVAFPLSEVREATGLSAKTLATELQRQVAHGRIIIPYRGFYVVVPPQYALKGIVPPTYYIHELMKSVGKPYYVCLLSAAAFHGAAHQRAMQTQVMTVAPRIRPSGMNKQLDWNYRQQIPQELFLSRNAEMGVVLYSNAELTAVDLVQFAGHVGGYQRAATVLSELIDTVDASKMAKVFPYTTRPQSKGWDIYWNLFWRKRKSPMNCTSSSRLIPPVGKRFSLAIGKRKTVMPRPTDGM